MNHVRKLEIYMVRSDATDIVQCNNDNNDDDSPQICICNAVGNIEQ